MPLNQLPEPPLEQHVQPRVFPKSAFVTRVQRGSSLSHRVYDFAGARGGHGELITVVGRHVEDHVVAEGVTDAEFEG